MPLADYISNSGGMSSATILNFEKKDPTPIEGINPLNYFYSQNGQWIQREIPVQILQFKIGKDPYKCEVQIDHPEVDKVQVVLRRIGEVWYIIEAGKNDLMKVNGLKKRQANIPQDSTVVVKIAETEFVFTTKSTIHMSEKELLTGPPEAGKGEYSLTTGTSELRFPFLHYTLLGSHAICDVNIPGEPFAGLITHLSKRLFFTPLALDPQVEITRDGQPIDEQTPLAPGSIIKIGDNEVLLKLSKELRFAQDFKFVPDPTEEHMMLLQIDEHGGPGKAFALPPVGRSIFIGRDPMQAKLVIPGSKKLSRKHAQVIVYDKTIMVIDNNATNGSFVNTTKIKKALVHPGDILRLADCNFILCFVG